jgi:eukaryotic-like serine/threonine-protein kinase
MSLAAGSRIGPYEVRSLLSEGGVGQVWRAHDTRLQRDVALKVLPAETLGDDAAAGTTSSPQAGSGSSRARLVREARLASQLNHPHICTIYEVGEAVPQTAFVLRPFDSLRVAPSSVEGRQAQDERRAKPVGSGLTVTYVAMELVEGQPLSARLADGPLPVDQVLRYGQQMADALAHAHGRGVVHRDLQSANIVITPDDQVKVLDFGLATGLTTEELAEATTTSRYPLTEPGMVAGTLAHLAPEQLRGQPADARSDIWALGVVLYELATGKPPFRGETGFELTSAILSQPLPPLPSSIPAPLAGVIDRCLTKEPSARYQQSTELRAALEAVASGQAGTAWRVVLRRHRGLLLGAATGALALLVVTAVLFGLDVGGVRSRITGGVAVPARIIRLAVLPFANLSGSPDQEYFSDGLTQDVTTQLGRLHPAGLEVIARTSAMRYKKRDTPIDQIGHELGVAYVLDGSAQRQGSRIRIAAALIQVAGGTTLWAETYERELAGILALQSEVARRVARALALKLLPAEQARLANARAVIPEAYDAYLRGTQLRQTAANVDAAERYFRLALEKDPAYAAAWAGIARVWSLRGQAGITPPRDATRESKAAARRALELDEADFEAHRALAGVLTWSEWDFRGAEQEWNRLITLDPNHPETLRGHSHFLMHMGRGDEAMVEIERAMELDPLSVMTMSFYAVVLEHARRYDDAMAAAREVLSLQSNQGIPSNVMRHVLHLTGRYDEALAMDREEFAKDPEIMDALERGYAEGGYTGAQAGIVRMWTARYGKPGVLSGTTVAVRCLYAGDREGALHWLQRAYEDGDRNVPYIGGMGSPIYEPLRSDPRFQDLLRRLGLPQ